MSIGFKHRIYLVRIKEQIFSLTINYSRPWFVLHFPGKNSIMYRSKCIFMHNENLKELFFVWCGKVRVFNVAVNKRPKFFQRGLKINWISSLGGNRLWVFSNRLYFFCQILVLNASLSLQFSFEDRKFSFFNCINKYLLQLRVFKLFDCTLRFYLFYLRLRMLIMPLVLAYHFIVVCLNCPNILNYLGLYFLCFDL